MSAKSELHELVHRLSEAEASQTLAYLRDLLHEEQPEPEDDLDWLIKQQGVKPLADPTRLARGIWPEDESMDAFIEALEAWRSEGKDG